MSTYPSSDCWIVRVQTDSYAGNFERQMTAFCTGMFGQCEVGKAEANRFNKEVEDLPFEDIIESFPDEYGCWRPCTMGGDDNTEVLMFFGLMPTAMHLDLIASRAKVFGEENNIKIEGFLLSELKVKYLEVTYPWESDE